MGASLSGVLAHFSPLILGGDSLAKASAEAGPLLVARRQAGQANLFLLALGRQLRLTCAPVCGAADLANLGSDLGKYARARLALVRRNGPSLLLGALFADVLVRGDLRYLLTAKRLKLLDNFNILVRFDFAELLLSVYHEVHGLVSS